jgi:hypothetical protein
MADETPFIENNSPDQPASSPQLHIDPTGQPAQSPAQGQPSYVQDFYAQQNFQTAQPQQPYQPVDQPYQPGNTQQQYQQPEQPPQQSYQQPYVQQRVFNQPANNRLLAMLMYWTNLVGLIMVVIVADRTDPFVKHHMNLVLQ